MDYSRKKACSTVLPPISYIVRLPGYKFLLNCFAPGERERLKAAHRVVNSVPSSWKAIIMEFRVAYGGLQWFIVSRNSWTRV